MTALTRLSPITLLAIAAGLALFLSGVAIATSLSLRQLDLPEGAIPLRLNTVELIDTDLIEEPDQLGSIPAMRAFFDRQSLLADQLNGDQVEVAFRTADGAIVTQTLEPRNRSLFDLPFPFWFQQGVGILALLVGGWVLSLRRNDWGAFMFGLTALFVPIFALAASVYSTRQIALDGELFRVLSAINHFGAAAFGFALVGLFLMYPRPMVHPRWLLLPLVVYGIGTIIDIAHVSETGTLDLMVMSQMLIAILLGIVQWWRSRGEPLDRAGLRWFFLFSLIGCSLFVGLSVVPPALDLTETGLISQAYAFGFFNLMHIGLALGVTRYRVFELDRYAYYVWLWLGGAFLIIGLDLLLLGWLQSQPWASLAIALIVGSFLYFPLRQVLLRRLFTSKSATLAGRMPDIMSVALAPTSRKHEQSWDEFLVTVFSPASDVLALAPGPERAEIAENGLALNIPAVQGLVGRQLRYAAGGRRLFNSSDVEVAQTAIQMHAVVSDSRRAFETGVTVERDRISRDVHDNIGAQLLTALHSTETSRKDDLLRDTLTDLRNIINDGFRAQYALGDILADLRSETADRLEAHDITMDWPAADNTLPRDISFFQANAIRAILREVVSNTIKHAGAKKVTVRIAQAAEKLQLEIWDDGPGFEVAEATGGNGLRNIEARAELLRGSADWDRSGPQTRLIVTLPLNTSDVAAGQGLSVA